MPSDEVLAYVQAELGLSQAQIERESSLEDLPTGPDLVLREGGQVFVVEVKAGRADLQAVGQLCMYRDVLARARSWDEEDIQLVLAAKSVPAGVEEVLAILKGHVVELPANLEIEATQSSVPLGKTQVTTDKAWRVICTLLERPVPSINQLHRDAGVSYGWTHKTVKNLEKLGVVGRESGLLTVTDRSRLLNGVAWERPLEALQTFELSTGFESVEEGGRELTHALDRAGSEFAFTAHTAASLYTGHGFRSDRAYLYATDTDLVQELVGEGDGPTLVVYEPDRRLEETQLREAIRLASPCQVLLDLAGMGPKAVDLRRAMVDYLA